MFTSLSIYPFICPSYMAWLQSRGKVAPCLKDCIVNIARSMKWIKWYCFLVLFYVKCCQLSVSSKVWTDTSKNEYILLLIYFFICWCRISMIQTKSLTRPIFVVIHVPIPHLTSLLRFAAPPASGQPWLRHSQSPLLKTRWWMKREERYGETFRDPLRCESVYRVYRQFYFLMGSE